MEEIIMRIFISQPMRGKSREQIEAERAPIVEALKAKGHEVKDSFLDNEGWDIKNVPLWCLGHSFVLLADCDAVLFMDGWEEARGCRMEYDACVIYGVPIMFQGV
jgi:hypothetical protein